MRSALHASAAVVVTLLLMVASPTAATLEPADSDAVDSIVRRLGREPAIGELRMPFASPDLVDPRNVFPDVTRYPATELAALLRYSRSCDDNELIDAGDPALAKARTWHRFSCGTLAALPPGFFEAEPRFHPGGSSFVALAARSKREPFDRSWLQDQLRHLHVLESDLIRQFGLAADDERLRLSQLSPGTLRRLVDRESPVIDAEWVFLLASAHSPIHPGAYRVYPRDRYDTLLAAGQGPYRRELVWTGIGTSLLLLGAVTFQALRKLRFRRLLMHERARVLRTLAHEVRTPTASLKLALEEVRSEYDLLPPPHRRVSSVPATRSTGSNARSLKAVAISGHSGRIRRRPTGACRSSR